MEVLIDNLNAIKTCKEDIKSALIEKGGDTYMDNVDFSGYADKIRELKISSGDEPSTPTPTVDYIYSNGYVDGGKPNEIITFVPHEIKLDESGKCVFYLTCPAEYPIYDGEHFDIIFTVDVPEKYNIDSFSLYAPQSTDADEDGYINQPYKENPRYSNIDRNGIIYNSYVRRVEDDNDMGSDYVATGTLQYRIIIK